MSDTKRPCHLVQEDIAWGRGLNPEDQAHAISCEVCSNTAARFEEMDALLREMSGGEVPSGFADKVIAAIEKKSFEPGASGSKVFPSFSNIFYSRSVQWALVGLGAVFGLVKIFRLVLGMWIQA